MMKYLLVSVFVLFMMSCQNRKQTSSKSSVDELQQADSIYHLKHATGFSIHYYKDYKIVKVHNPWNEGEDLGIYKLSNTKQKGFIKTPVTNWSVFASTQVCYAEKLGVLNSIYSIAEPKYIKNEYLTTRLNEGVIRSVGMATSPDAEVLLAVDPQLVMVSPYKNESYALLNSLDLNVVYNASYMENTPLGRAEWLIFLAAFFNKEDLAMELYNGIEERYLNVKNKLKDIDELSQPSVFTGRLYQGTWYVPGGDSYIANYFKDAGAQYIFSYIDGAAALPSDYETVFSKGIHSDYWFVLFNKSKGFSYKQMRNEDERYGDFDAFQNQNVICSNTRYSGYFEKGLLQPDVVLNDLASLFHPNLFNGYSRVYIDFMQADDE